jgi:sulfur carrier protein ThiS
MAVIVLSEGRPKKVKMGKGFTVADVLRSAGINPQEVLVKVKGTIVPDDLKVRDGQKLETLRVVSGG